MLDRIRLCVAGLYCTPASMIRLRSTWPLTSASTSERLLAIGCEAGQRHPLLRQVVALAERRPEDLRAVLVVDEARRHRRGQDVGVGDAVVATERIGREQLGEKLKSVMPLS